MIGCLFVVRLFSYFRLSFFSVPESIGFFCYLPLFLLCLRLLHLSLSVHFLRFHLSLFFGISLCVTVIALSGIATDVEVSIHEIQTLLDEEDKQEKEFQVQICYLSIITIVSSL